MDHEVYKFVSQHLLCVEVCDEEADVVTLEDEEDEDEDEDEDGDEDEDEEENEDEDEDEASPCGRMLREGTGSSGTHS